MLCQGTLNVQIPSATESLNSSPNNPRANQVITFALTNLLKDPIFGYTLDFGDGGAPEAVTVKSDGGSSLKHTYLKTGVFVVKLRLTAPGSPDLIRATLSLQIVPPFALNDLGMEITKPTSGQNVQVKQDDPLEVTLRINYQGSGTVNGNFVLDGKAFASESIDLTSAKTSVVFKLDNLPTTELGLHVLRFEVTSLEADGQAVPVGANRLKVASYDVISSVQPTLLSIGGFIIKITQVTNASISNFSGKGKHELIVGGALAKEINLEFNNLTVSISSDASGVLATVKTGQINTVFAPALEIVSPVGLSPSKVNLTRLLLTVSGAKVSGFASMPDPSPVKSAPVGSSFFVPALLDNAVRVGPIGVRALAFRAPMTTYVNLSVVKFMVGIPQAPSKTFVFNDQDLQPITGDLFASGLADIPDYILGQTGVVLKGDQPAVLDLSLSQSPNQLSDAYAATSTPPDTSLAWVGIFFPNAKIEPTGDVNLSGIYSSLPSVPLAYSQGGYSFDLKLGAGNGKIKGWTVKIDTLELGVFQTEVVKGGGTGKLRVPFLEEDLDASFAFQPGGSWVITTSGLVKHNFGSSEIIAGIGTFNNANQLVFADAVWGIANLATERVKGSSSDSFVGGNFDPKAKTDIGALATKVSVSASEFAATNPTKPTYSSSSAIVGDFYSTAVMVTPGAGASPSGNDNGLKFGGLGSAIVLSEIKGNADIILELANGLFAKSSVQLPLTNLTITSSGDISIDGSPYKGLLGGGDIKILSFPFPSNQIGLGKDGDRYFIGLKGKQELGKTLPSVASELRYYVKNGKNLEVVVTNAGFRKQLNISAVIEIEASERHLPLSSGTTLSRAKSGTLLYSTKAGQNLSKDTASAKIDFRDTGDGWELEINAKMSLGEGKSGVKVVANALFGNRVSSSTGYWYVYADVENPNAPFVTLFEILNVHGVFGGVAYHMKWDTSKGIKSYQQPPNLAPKHHCKFKLESCLPSKKEIVFTLRAC